MFLSVPFPCLLGPLSPRSTTLSLLASFRARNAQGLMNHINQKHPVEPSSWTCEHCGKVYRHKGYFTLHTQSCPAAPAPPPPPAPAGPSTCCGSHRCSAQLHLFLPSVWPTFVSGSQQRRHEREQCLHRPGSGAIVSLSGELVLPCPVCQEPGRLLVLSA